MNVTFPPGACIGFAGDPGAALTEARSSGAQDWTEQFKNADPFTRGTLAIELNQRRQAGETIVVASHDLHLLAEICDEVWWFEKGELRMQGAPAQVLAAFRAQLAQKLRAWGVERGSAGMQPAFRRGDGRAEVLSLETVNAAGQPTMIWQGGEEVAVRLQVRFLAETPAPVIGIMIRTRIGFAVYGTNTELEQLQVGPCQAGDVLEVGFAFRCDLCPGDYTITAASHDPDGTAHDWVDDAVAFAVTDSRYTAGVANLRARASAIKQQGKNSTA